MSTVAEMVDARPMRASRRPEELLSPEKPLKVLVDARKLGGGGIGVYIDNLITGLLSNGGVQPTVIVNSQTELHTRGYGELEVIEDRAKLYSLDELWGLPRRIDLSSFDLFHSPHYTLPFRLPIPSVVTVHDLIHITHPERFYYPFVAKRLIRSALKRATRVLAVSNATAHSLTVLMPRAKEKISVVPNALDPFYLIETGTHGDDVVQGGKPYFIATFSNIKRHKAIEDLLGAFVALKARGAREGDPLAFLLREIQLVLVGQGTDALRGSGKIPEGVTIAGAVSTRELHALYAGGTGLVVSSLAEGFCLPVIEAQACGTPVVVRPVPAVLELMTTNDYVCKDMSVESLTDGMYEFLKKRFSDAEENDYGVPLEHMRRFCREDVTRAVVNVYRQAVHDFRDPSGSQ